MKCIHMNRIHVLVALASLCLATTTTGAISIRPKKTTVIVSNDLGDDVEVIVRCKSEDSDLGLKQLNYGESFEFTFRRSFWGKTQFYCHMVWCSQPRCRQSHWFNIYIQWRDKPKCSRCLWKIRTDGPCMFNYVTNAYDICYPWNEDTTP